MADRVIWSDAIADEAAAIHARVRRTLQALEIPGDLVWTGGSSVPRNLTRGDVDLHLRVPAESFAGTDSTLREKFPIGSPHSWADTLAVRDIPDQPLPTGLAVTPIDSQHDRRFTRAWVAPTPPFTAPTTTSNAAPRTTSRARPVSSTS